jgi:hypothetical protein
MPSFYECLDPQGKIIWKALMQAFECKSDPETKHYPVQVHNDFEDLGEVERQMQIIPGFDRSEDG